MKGGGSGSSEPKDECVVCSDAVATVRLEPCRHQPVCEDCCIKMKKCIVCKTVIKQKIGPSESV